MRPLETGRSGRRMHSPLVPQDDTTHVEAVEGGGRYEEVSGVVKVRDGAPCVSLGFPIFRGPARRIRGGGGAATRRRDTQRGQALTGKIPP